MNRNLANSSAIVLPAIQRPAIFDPSGLDGIMSMHQWRFDWSKQLIEARKLSGAGEWVNMKFKEGTRVKPPRKPNNKVV